VTGLSRDRIVEAAIALVGREGLGELSMRRLAADLGAGTMSIYNHVASKEDLLDAMVEHVVADVRVSNSPDWREVVTTWATDTRRTLLDHRPLIPLVVAPGRVEHVGRVGVAVREALVRSGLREGAAALIVRVVARYTAGAVVLDAPRDRRARPPRAALDATFAAGLEALLRGLDAQIG
jgi:AcrR family transcriptional regulator